MEVGIDRLLKPLTQSLGSTETHLEARDEIDVQSVEISHHWAQLRPSPARHAARHALAASLAGLIVEHDPVVWCCDLDTPATRCEVRQSTEELLGFASEIPSHLDQGDDLPIRREASVESREGVRDTTPLFDRRCERVASVYEIPY